ncbi:MAG TPA: FtsX-like permease family protein [Parafilimonas sp.]|nr:FtsX-like permease family protein [Parafilimonas sp.]
MFKNYFIVAFRNFWRNKVFSLINIIGLSIGICASLVIYLVVSYDFSFDKFENDRDHIYRIVTTMHFPGQEFRNSGVPLPIPPAVKKEVTGIDIAAPFHTGNGEVNVSIAGAGKPVVFKKQKDIIYADDNYFKLFPYHWLSGSGEALKQPFTVVITESRARAYFPYKDVTEAVGQVISYNDSIKATVTGIVKDLDANTDFTFKEFISYSTIENSGLKNNMGWGEWGSINSASQFFVKLNPNADTVNVRKQIEDLQKRNGKNAYLAMSYYLQPLSDIHFNANYGAYSDRQANLPTLYGLLVVAAILLLLGCINFINLTTAQAAQRAKEIGIRKTMGGSKKQLIFQFLSETFLLTVIATVLSLLLVPILLKIFSDFIAPEINIEMLTQTNVMIFIIGLVIVVTLFSGFYPSLVLSGFKPVLVLKNQAFSNTSKTRRAWLRKSLTVTQFIAAQAFIIGAIIVTKQIHYTLNKDLGFRKDGIVILNTPWNFNDADGMGKRQVLLQKLKAIPQIEQVCLGGSPPATNGISMSTMKFNNGKKEIETTVEVKYADADYFNLYKMKLIAGRFPAPADSSTEYVINENYARFLGFKDPSDAVGKFVDRSGKKVPVVGVLADFYSQSLHTPIKPLVFTADKEYEATFHILLKPNSDGDVWKHAISQIEKSYKAIYPDDDVDYNFLDENIASFYKSEQNISRLLKWATGLAIFISCLGLLGLVIYTTNQRTKEIGVRKVLGASVSQLVALISKDFMALVVFAFVIAAPLGWWAMHKWLQNFAYRTDISWWIFPLGGILMILIALITLGFQTIRTASANPVQSLRTE